MNKYGTILTNAGAAAIANATALGTKTEVTQIAVGDGNGGYYQPLPTQTALRKEVWRGEPSSAEVSETSPNVVIVNAVIPPDVGGWTMREVGLFNAANQLLAVGNMPDQQKIISAQGTSSEFHIRFELAVSNAEDIKITIDPYLILATKRDIESHNSSPTAHPSITLRISELEKTMAGANATFPQIEAHISELDGKISGLEERMTAAETLLATLPELETLIGLAMGKSEENAGKIAVIMEALFGEVKGKPFQFIFGDLTPITLTSGLWNRPLSRLEC